MKTYNVDKNGFYGHFGGAYISEELKTNIETLTSEYLQIITTEEFRHEFDRLLHNYVGRPTPLYYASRLSRHYGCHIYLKREDLNHTGAHKINNAIGQAILARHMGKTHIIAETGAGQHGVATATVCALMDMRCTIFMGEEDISRQRSNVEKIKMLGAEVVSVSEGNSTLSDAVDAAIKYWTDHPEETYYLIGSAVGPHPFPDMVARFQSVISAEIKLQLLEKEGRDYPDYLMACIGGGSNAAGSIYHYLDDERVNIILAEAAGRGVDSGYTAATATSGRESVLHGSRTLVLRDNNGNLKPSYSISAGLDYPGIGPMHANLAETGRARFIPVTDKSALTAAYLLTREEGIIPAIESAHVLAALEQVSFDEDDIVVLTVSGRGDKDMEIYLAAQQES